MNAIIKTNLIPALVAIAKLETDLLAWGRIPYILPDLPVLRYSERDQDLAALLSGLSLVAETAPELLDWREVSRYSRISEGFISDNASHVDWGLIWRYQRLTPGFIKKYGGGFDAAVILKYQQRALAHVPALREAFALAARI